MKLKIAAVSAALLGLAACAPENKMSDYWGDEPPAASEMVYDGPLKASGDEGSFTSPSEVRYLSNPQNPKPITVGGLGSKQIAITIDDGPSKEYNAEVLRTLRDHGVKATFFLVGRNVKAHPELVEDILREGHSVANHTWSHPEMNKIGSAKAAKEIDDTQALLEQIAKKVGIPIQPFFRFPYGQAAGESAMVKLMSDRGLANFHWAMSTHDSRTKDGSVALNTAVAQLGSKNRGGILLMHETHVAGVKALPYLLKELKRRGYTTIYYKAQ